jgi:hypothetical protein
MANDFKDTDLKIYSVSCSIKPEKYAQHFSNAINTLLGGYFKVASNENEVRQIFESTRQKIKTRVSGMLRRHIDTLGEKLSVDVEVRELKIDGFKISVEKVVS